MTSKVFHVAQARAIFADQCTGLVGGDFLISTGFEELANPQATRVSRCLIGRQGMVGANDFVAISDIGTSANEVGAIVLHMLRKPIVATRHDLHMLGSELIGFGQHLFVCIANNHLAKLRPTLRGNRGGWQNLELALDFSDGVFGQPLAVGEQHSRRRGAVLALAEQINSTDFSIDRLVSNDQGFCWASKQINADAAIKLALGFCHKHIARTDQHIHRLDGLRANRHGGHGLHAPQSQDLVRASKVHGGNDGWMRRTMEGGRCRHNTLNTRNFRREHTHMSRRNHGVFATRHIAAHGTHGHMLVPQDDTGHGLNFHLFHAVKLSCSESANLFLCELNVFNFPRAE